MEKKVILASGSPRRRELLARMGVSFEVDAADVDESAAGEPAFAVRAVAERKARAVAPRHPEDIVLAADTIVDCDGMLGKPKDAADARRMLSRLSGRWHAVYTGVCVLYRAQMRLEVAATRVHFTPITQEEIARYIETGDPMDKAGAYGMQGMAGMFIDEMSGCPHNVMGLPMALTKRMLALFCAEKTPCL